MKNSAIKTIALVAFVTLSSFALQSQARIMGLLAESVDGSENLKIESVGTPLDALIKVSFEGYETQLEPGMNSAFRNLNGSVSLAERAGAGYEDAIVISLTQEPQFPPFFNAFIYPESEREAKSAEWNAKAAVLYGTRTQFLNLKQDILAKLIKEEYVEQIYAEIIHGNRPLVIAIQSKKAGGDDYSYKFIRLDRKTFFTGGEFYKTDSAKSK
jgi:hypothetical protein